MAPKKKSTTLNEIVQELQTKLLAHHGLNVGYKLHVQDGEASISMEVYIPRANNHATPVPEKDLSTEMVEKALHEAGFSDQPLKVEVDADGKIVVKKTKKLEPWAEVNTVLRTLDLRWIQYNENDKDNTGLWRQP